VKFRATLLLTSLFSLGWPSLAVAFPELTRHGYVNCTACHVSPAGGGAINEYGRELSKEVLSMWARESEQQIGHGLIPAEKIPSNVILGGDVRVIQTYRNNARVREAQFLTMQADLEAGFRLGKFTISGRAGRVERGNEESIEFRQGYLMADLSDEVHVRVGKFQPVFGLNIPEHFTAIKRMMGFAPYSETRNLEVSWTGEQWSLFSTVFLEEDQAQVGRIGRGSGFSQQLTTSFLGRDRTGFSLMGAETELGRMEAVGFHTNFGITHDWFILAEQDLRWDRAPGGAARPQKARYVRLGHELRQGVVLSLLHEDAETSGNNGLGLQWFPRPHLELNAQFFKTWNEKLSPAGGETGFFLAHYYL
jgi:hypothetical protein